MNYGVFPKCAGFAYTVNPDRIARGTGGSGHTVYLKAEIRHQEVLADLRSVPESLGLW